MPTCRVFSNPNGTVRIMYLNDRYRLPEETDDAFFSRETAKQSDLIGLPFADIDISEVPTDRRNRNRWRLIGNSLRVVL